MDSACPEVADCGGVGVLEIVAERVSASVVARTPAASKASKWAALSRWLLSVASCGTGMPWREDSVLVSAMQECFRLAQSRLLVRGASGTWPLRTEHTNDARADRGQGEVDIEQGNLLAFARRPPAMA